MIPKTKLFLKITALFSLVFLAVITSKRANSQSQFETSYDINYKIDRSGITTVTQNIEVKNKEDDILATNYSVTVKQMDMYEISGEDTAGELEIDVQRNSEKGTSIINAVLNEKVIGKDRSNKIKITYKTKDLANKVGSIWNVNLPRTANLGEIKDYKVTVEIPNSLGPLNFISPTPKEQSEEDGVKIFKFSKEELSNESITAAFGKNQLVNFQLFYHLENNTILPDKQEIALPPTIEGKQEVYYEKLDPKPTKVYKDEDGNIMAIYRLMPNSEQRIQLTGAAKISGKQIKPSYGGKMQEIPTNLVRKYTGDQPFWEVDSEKIQEISDDLFDPEKTASQNAQKAYEYVTENLEYNLDIVKENYIERQGALKAITEDKPWACMEFTDLFIAITRAMGIPSRELNGYAFSAAEDIIPVSIDLRGGDMLHAWPEYYDPNFGWVAVDPTWGTTSGIDYFTKLDTNHFAFVVKGKNSEYPFPAGSYRLDPNEKQVNVDFAETERDFKPKIKIVRTLTFNPIRFLRGERRYKLVHQEGPILMKLANTQKNLLPFQSKILYLPKEQKSINYMDYNNLEKKLTF